MLISDHEWEVQRCSLCLRRLLGFFVLLWELDVMPSYSTACSRARSES